MSRRTAVPASRSAGGNTTASNPAAAINVAGSRAARQQHIAQILAEQPVRSQAELLARLTEQGLSITQSTLSRDLDEMGVMRIRKGGGPLLYALPSPDGDTPAQLSAELVGTTSNTDPRLQRVASQLLVSAQANDDLVVVRTPPGAAQFLASALDGAQLPQVLGTVAGDDTILIIGREAGVGPELATHLLDLAKRRT